MYTAVLLLLTSALLFSTAGRAQTTISTNFTNNNSNYLVTFNFVNNNASPVMITSLASISTFTGATTAELWYKSGAINGSPGNISVANGWTQATSQPVTTSASTLQTMLNNINLTIPASTTYGLAFCVQGGLSYSTIAAGTYTFSGGGCDLVTGTNIGYGGGVPPNTPVNTPRGFLGSITFVSVVPCSGTPTPGNTVSSPSTVCPNSNFTLSLQNSQGTGTTYQWQSSPDGITWTNITGATNSTYTTNINAPTYYQCVVTCTNSGLSATSTPILVNVAFSAACYCTSAATTTADEEIFNVTAGTLNNSSTCATLAPGTGSVQNRYSNYTSGPGIPAAPTFMQGSTVSTSLTISSCGSFNYTSGAAIFIDYNQDGDFLDPGEQVWNNGTTANINCVPASVVTGSFVVPLSATPGTTVMRIIDAEGYAGSSITPCLSTYGYGETEDYLVTIAAAAACSGTPSPGAASATATTVCPNSTTVLSLPSLPAATGYTFQWQSSPDGITWTNIAGATSANYTATLTATTYYQCVVTCTNSGLSATSTPVMVTVSMSIGCYCTSAATTTFDEEIFNVKVGNLNNSSTCATTAPGTGSIQNRYSNYTSGPGAPAAVQLTQGYTYADSITVSTCGSFNYSSGAAIFIDYNQDGDFLDAGEMVWNSGSTANINCLPASVVPGSFTVPLTALTGTTYMRVIDAEGYAGTSITPCLNTYGYGETEDYLVTILPAPPIDMGATALYRPLNTGCHTTNDSVTITIKNYSTTTINFATNPVTVNASVTGPNPVTFPGTVVNTGTLVGGASMNVTVSTTYNMTAAGTYVFNASTSVTGDGTPANDAMPAATIMLSGGVATANPSVVCTGSSTNLVLTGQTSGATIQWESSPDGITWTPIAGATTNPYSIIPTGVTYYHAIVCGNLTSAQDTVSTVSVAAATPTNTSRCGPGSVTMNASATDSIYWYTQSTGGTSVHVGNSYTASVISTDTFYVENVFTYCGSGGTPAAPTCYPTYSNACSSSDFINNFSTTGGSTNISNLNSGCNGISPTNTTFFPGQVVTMYPGGTFNFSVQSGSSFGQGHHIWIDYNNDGDFVDAGEDVWASPTTSTAVYTGSITVPAGTVPGPKRIRVMCRYATIPASTDVCSSSLAFGEVEEYTLNVCTQCSSVRSPLVVTVTAPPTMTVTAQNSSLCGADTTLLSIATTNTNYQFTWSPATALNTTTGDSVMFMPTAPGSYTYVINANDTVTGCANVDTLTVSMSPAPVITAAVDNDSVCGGTLVNLSATTPNPTVQISNGNFLNTSTTYPAPYGNWYGGSRHQMLITAAELTAAGLNAGYLNGLTFQVTNTNASAPLTNFTIKLGLTSVTSLTTTFQTSPMTTVYTNPSYAPIVGTNTHNFSTPFYWDGISNILVETCFINQTGPTTTSYTTNCTMRQIGTTYASTTVYYADNDLNACSATTGWTTYNQRPNIAFLRSFGWAYTWAPSSVSNPNIQNPTATPTVTTTYTVTATDTTSGCTTTSSIMVFVKPTPHPMLGADTIICSNTPLTLDASAGNYTYLWSDSTVAQTLTVSTFGNYDVLVTDTTSGCTGADTILVGVNQAPVFSLGSDATICSGTQVTFSGPAGQYSYMWSNAATTQAITTGTAGPYTLTVTDTTNACYNSDTVALNVNPLPPVALGNDTSVCSANTPLTLSAPAGNYAYLWNDASTNQTLAVNATGTYYVVVTDNVTSCYAGDTLVVVVNASPSVTLGNDTTFCSGNGPITLTATNGPYNYMWNDASTNMTLTTNTTGMYYVTITDSVTGCTASDSINVNVPMTPAVTLNDTTMCATSYTLMGPSGPYSYLWSNSQTTQNITVTSPGGNFSLVVTDTISGCAGSDAANITVNTPPVVVFALQDTACTTDAAITMSATPAGGSFSGPGVSGNVFSPSVAGVGTHSITYSYTDANGCSDMASQDIIVSACVGIDEPFIAAGMSVYPNPNNGSFTLTIQDADYNEMMIEIVTVDGKVIFSDKASNVKGNYVRPLSVETYANGIYFLRITANGQTFVQKIVKND